MEITAIDLHQWLIRMRERASWPWQRCAEFADPQVRIGEHSWHARWTTQDAAGNPVHTYSRRQVTQMLKALEPLVAAELDAKTTYVRRQAAELGMDPHAEE